VLEEHPDERVLALENKLQQTELDLQETKKQYEAANKQLQDAQKQIQNLKSQNSSQKRKEQTVSRTYVEEFEQRMKERASAIAERTPSETQKIIANQVELGADFYEEVGAQSHESFHLSLWLTIAGGCIFFLTVAATVLVTLVRGNGALISIIGSAAAALTEGLAASNRLYNQASQQFAAFQVDLDRINRSSIGYAMVSEDEFEKKTPKQQEAIIKIVESLQSS
jgi:peptidoglycan hydrolase CwlO-like protein